MGIKDVRMIEHMNEGINQVFQNFKQKLKEEQEIVKKKEANEKMEVIVYVPKFDATDKSGFGKKQQMSLADVL